MAKSDQNQQIILNHGTKTSGSFEPYRGPATYEGREYSTINDEMSKAAHMSQAEVRALQQRLENAGLLEPGKYQAGFFDAATQDAYNTLLDQAHNSEQTPNETFDAYDAAVAKYGRSTKAGAARQGEIVSLTDPGTIKTMADKLIPNVIGRKLTDAELNAAVSLYHAAEKAHADAAYAAQGSGGPGGPGGTVSDVQDLSSFLESEAQRLHPTEYAQQGELNTLGGVASMISGGKPSL